MQGLFEPIIQNLETIIATGGYFTLFAFIILDSVPLIGVLVPGTTIIIVAGFLASLGVMNPVVVLLVAVSGSITGDVLGYLIGKRYGYAFADKVSNYVPLGRSYIDKARNAIQKNTALAVLVGRFSPVTRAFTPFAIGASGVRFGKFWLYDCLGSAGWALSFVVLGYLFGGSYKLIESFIGTISTVAVFCGVFIFWGYSFINRTFHIWSKYELFALVANLLSVYLFFKMFEDAFTVPSFLAQLDIFINQFFLDFGTNTTLYISHILSTIGSPAMIGLGGLLVSSVLFFRNNIRLGLVTFGSTILALFLNLFIKDLVLRSRPIDAYLVLPDYSFPSTHATMSAVAMILVMYIFAPRIKNFLLREIVVTGFFVFVAFVGLSRLVLGVHWFTDVVAGYALGVFCATSMILLVRYGMMIWGKWREGKKSKEILDIA